VIEMDWSTVLSDIIAGKSLGRSGAHAALASIVSGEATPAQSAAFLVAYKFRLPQPEELAGMVDAMLEAAERVDLGNPLLDTCGTGGDRSGSINVSTLAAFVAAAAGAKVAKHGNRAASSRCGSADLLEAMGATIDLGPEEVGRCLEESGMCFLFARRFHPAMRNVAPVRQELGIPTVMNLLGPLCNPAGASFHAMGVADPSVARLVVETAPLIGRERAVIFHGHGALDELSISGPSTVWELEGGEVASYVLNPEEFGIEPAPVEAVAGGDPARNKEIAFEVLEGKRSPYFDFTALNAAAALLAADLVESIEEGFELATSILTEGKALQTAERFIEASRRVAASSQ
jgi:anthranilate phosphoribosyltransferase